jgi:hypothetical protein
MSRSDAWQQEKFYNLRDRSVLKSSYRAAGDNKYGPDHCSNCETHRVKERKERENHQWRRNIAALGLVVGTFFLYMLLIRKVPYCDGQSGRAANFAEGQMSHCDYNDEVFSLIPLSETCKQCPANAECNGTTMVSQNVSTAQHSTFLKSCG